jgi:3-isopropylmalate/(R)-2-methylmalate dehydratase large subunit
MMNVNAGVRSMTFAEKMFAKASGNPTVMAGDIVHPDPELVIVHDGYLEAAYRELHGVGYGSITKPERVVVVTDHEVVYAGQPGVARGRANRRIVQEWHVGRFFDAGQGGHGHIHPMESGLVKPGMFLAAYDMHASNFGAIGAYAMATGQDITVLLATGTMWSAVPETYLVELTGKFPMGVHPRDIGFSLSHDLATGRYGFTAEAAVVEFCGEAIEKMPVATRVGLINTLTEIYVAHVLFPPMQFNGEPVAELQHLRTDEHAKIAGRITLNLGDATPKLALPGAPDNAAEISAAAGQRVDHCFIGACGSSHYEDFADAAAVMKGRHVAPNVRFYVVPGTVATAARMMRDGLSQTFLEAGAIILPSGCGPCVAGKGAPVGPGEVSISTAATNSPGRMGSMEAEYFLGSPLTVAASAVTGKIVDPRELLA